MKENKNYLKRIQRDYSLSLNLQIVLLTEYDKRRYPGFKL